MGLHEGGAPVSTKVQYCLKEYSVDLKDPHRPPVHNMTEVGRGEGNVYSSEHRWAKGMHIPLLDFDGFPVQLLDSSTPGNTHLYIGKPVTWEQFCKILDAFLEAGLLQEGFVELSKARGAAFLRKPGVLKEPGDINSGVGWRF